MAAILEFLAAILKYCRYFGRLVQVLGCSMDSKYSNELIHLRHIIQQNPLYVPICP